MLSYLASLNLSGQLKLIASAFYNHITKLNLQFLSQTKHNPTRLKQFLSAVAERINVDELIKIGVN